MNPDQLLKFYAIIVGVLGGAWATHIIVTVQALIDQSIDSVEYGVVLVLGIFIPPIGMVHGIGIWLGIW